MRKPKPITAEERNRISRYAERLGPTAVDNISRMNEAGLRSFLKDHDQIVAFFKLHGKEGAWKILSDELTSMTDDEVLELGISARQEADRYR